ncbi:MAG: Flp family type IVb pilin [Pseudomonadota bacterium]
MAASYSANLASVLILRSSANMIKKYISVRRSLARFIRDESGLTAIEYGIMGTLIALAAVAFSPGFAAALSALFQAITGILSAVPI